MNKIISIIITIICLAACSSNNKSSITVNSTVYSTNDVTTIPNDSTIQRQIWGIKLAETPIDSALVIMKELGHSLDYIGPNQHVFTNRIYFGSKEWDGVYILSYNNLVSCIKFVSFVNYHNKPKIDEEAKDLYNKLKDKYPILYNQYNKGSIYDDNGTSLFLMDERTVVSLMLEKLEKNRC